MPWLQIDCHLLYCTSSNHVQTCFDIFSWCLWKHISSCANLCPFQIIHIPFIQHVQAFLIFYCTCTFLSIEEVMKILWFDIFHWHKLVFYEPHNIMMIACSVNSHTFKSVALSKRGCDHVMIIYNMHVQYCIHVCIGLLPLWNPAVLQSAELLHDITGCMFCLSPSWVPRPKCSWAGTSEATKGSSLY